MALQMEKQALTQTGETLRRSLETYLQETKSLVRSLAIQNAVIEAFEGRPERARERLQSYMKAYRDSIWAIFAFDDKGRILAGYNADMADLPARTGPERISSRRRRRPGRLRLPRRFRGDQRCERACLCRGHVRRDDQGKHLGGVVVLPRWSTVTQTILDPLRFGERGYGFIIDNKGVIIAHAADKGFLLKDFSGHGFIQEALRVKNGMVEYDWKGEDKFMSVSRMPETDWYLCMSAYASEMTETANSQRNVLMAVGAVVIMAVVLVIWLFLRALVNRPLAAIGAFTTRIAAQDYRAELTGTFRFEMKDLSDNIQAMVAEIKNKLGFSQGLLDAMTISCIVADPQGKILFVNHRSSISWSMGASPPTTWA
jgi:methyl-accepting chemotaxis protein